MGRDTINEREQLDEIKDETWAGLRKSDSFQSVLALASNITGVKTVLLNLAAPRSQETIASLNWSGAESIPREHSLSEATVSLGAAHEIVDLARDAACQRLPVVVGPPQLRFYAGAPIVNRTGTSIGALCVVDTTPRSLAPTQIEDLQLLAKVASEMIESHSETGDFQREKDSWLRLYQRAIEASSSAVIISDALDPELPILYVNPAFENFTGYSKAEVLGRNCRFLQGSDTNQSGRRELRAAIADRRDGDAVLRNFRKDGSEFWVDVHLSPVLQDGRVTHFVGFQMDVTDRIRRERDIVHMATHDSLTGLPNRALLRDRLQQMLERYSGTSNRFAVAFLDLDRFKLINDGLGHAKGDELLCEVAERLRSLMRTGTVARMGGDEFVLLVTDFPDEEALLQKIDNVHHELRRPREKGISSVVIEASIGLAIYPEHGRDVIELLRNADAAMYHAKSRGRAGTQLYRSTLTADITRKLTLQSELHSAIDRREFVLHYQPQFFRGGGLSGVEALVRWNHPTRGLLYPGTFIPAAEEFGLIEALGRWVLLEACRQNQEWQQADLFYVPVSVNVSVAQLRKSSFVEDVSDALQSTGLAARYLDLEITESMVMEAPERIVGLLDRLRRLGTKSSIDDFGTGHSSLSFIRRFALDALKIDRSFVRDLATEPSAAALCDTIIRMAHNLGFRVVAEGVETIEQATFLEAHGCDMLQGFLFAEGKSPNDLVTLLIERGWLRGATSPELPIDLHAAPSEPH